MTTTTGVAIICIILWFSASASVAVSTREHAAHESSNSCIDIVDWVDSSERTCQFYSSDANEGNKSNNSSKCDLFGDDGFHLGHVANSACCACNGGVQTNHMIHPQAINVPVRPTRPTSTITNSTGTIDTSNNNNHACLDRPGWKGNIGDVAITCDNFGFRPDITKQIYSCAQFGHVKSQNIGLSAHDSCCLCNGGYNGTLIGKTLRVTIVDDLEEPHMLFSASAKEKDGSIIQFMKEAASVAGFGMYEVELSEEAREFFPDSQFDACRLDVRLGMTDMCLGHFWRAPGGDITYSNAFVTDAFYLIVPKVEGSTLDLLLTPILPFTKDAWLWIAFTCLYVGIVLNVIRRDRNKLSFCKRIEYILFASVKSCTLGDIHDSDETDPDMSEKIVVIGFVIFALITLTAYTATSAAFLVSTQKGFTSLDDIINNASHPKVCINQLIFYAFMEKYPLAESVLEGKPYDTETFLDLVIGDSDECHAAIVPAGSFAQLQKDDARFCKNILILLDKMLLEVDVVVLIYALLGDVGLELRDTINTLIDEGVYSAWHQFYLDRFQKNNRQLQSTQDVDEVFVDYECRRLEINLEKFQLSDMHLLMPISLSLFCSTVALAMYVTHEIRSTTTFRRKAAQMFDLSEKEEEALVLDELQNTAPSVIVSRLVDLHSVEQGDLDAALDALPDKGMLVDLLSKNIIECSLSLHQRKDFHVIDELTLRELYTLVRYYCKNSFDVCDQSLRDSKASNYFKTTSSSRCKVFDDEISDFFSKQTRGRKPGKRSNFFFQSNNKSRDEFQLAFDKAIDSPENPKEALIDLILNHDAILHTMALRCARIKANFYNEQSADCKFDIMQHVHTEHGRVSMTSTSTNFSLLEEHEYEYEDDADICEGPACEVFDVSTAQTSVVIHDLNVQKIRFRRLESVLSSHV
eukprot:CAMPEP_0196826460 /NCGR_PEP_ID=MMETSP1362-20130617/93638_1 /TAXON_ID=163516 /ORGANISM="Leptocylindrus danicus, Strain CCMP1856" /LENGTH=918 /DNA_ID=CAMNT_0042207033 /DNA_START=493 /DNA_END=3249 /DNA_ORIENTATION=+